MKNLKKILALVLAFACAFTMFAVAGAADFTDKASIKNYEAVNTLVALNILKGRENGSFDPDATVTRAEMTKMIYVIWNGGKDDATAYEGVKSNFSDVSDHWARGYINFCASNNIVAGMGDGTFAPDQTVTGQQAAKMLLVLMGYDDKNAGLTGPKWAQNTMNYASLAGLFKDVNSPLEQGMPRQYAAQMVYNTLEANRVKWSTDNGAFDEITQWSGNDFVKETVGERYMNYTTVTGILVEARNGDQKGFSILTSPNANGKYNFDPTDKSGDDSWDANLWVETKYTTDLSEYLGQEVKVSYNSNEYKNNRDSVYGVFSTNQNVVVTTTANKIADAKEADKVKIDGTKYKIADHLLYYYSTIVNGNATDLTSGNYIDNDGSELKNVFGNTVNIKVGSNTQSGQLYDDFEPLIANTVKFVDYDNDGKFDLAIDYPMAVAEVSMVSASTLSVKDVRGVDLTTNAPKREDVIAYDGIAKGDIVQVTWDTFQDKVKFTKLTTTDETIGSVRNDVNANNEEYNISTGWVKRFSKTNGLMGNNNITTKLKSGDKATFVVIGGIAYYVDRTQSGTGNDVAVVVSVGDTYSGGADGGSVEVKLMFADGTTEVVTVDSIIPNWNSTSKDTNGNYNDDTYSYDLDSNDIRSIMSLKKSDSDLTVLTKYLAGFTYNTPGDNQAANGFKQATITTQSGSTQPSKSYNTLLKDGSIAPALVTYSRSGGDYTLQLLDWATNDAGYDSVKNDVAWSRKSNDATVDGKNLLDDGTVFVVYGSSSVKRYTGAQAKKLSVASNDTTATDGVKSKAYSLVEKSNGVERARIAAVYANTEPKVSGAGNYAYLLDTTNSKTIDGTSYIVLTAYTKNGAETLYAEKNASSRSTYNKGDVVDFSYTSSNITDNGTEYRLIDDVDPINAEFAAVTGWDRDDISVLVDYALDKEGKETSSRGQTVDLDVDTDDTTVLVVDTDGKVGVSVGKDGIQTANEWKRNGTDGYYVNAKVYYFGNGSNADAFELIVVDSVNNWMDDDMHIAANSGVTNYTTSKGTITNNSKPITQKNAQQLLNEAASGAAVALDIDQIANYVSSGSTLTIPNGKTLRIKLNSFNNDKKTAYDVTYEVNKDTNDITILNGTGTLDFSNIVGETSDTYIEFTGNVPGGSASADLYELVTIKLKGLPVLRVSDICSGAKYSWERSNNAWKFQTLE